MAVKESLAGKTVVNKALKLRMIERLTAIQREIEQMVANVAFWMEKITATVKSSAVKAMKDLNKLSEYCAKCISFISSYDDMISSKFVYNPIEAFLTSDSESLSDEIKGPELIIQDSYMRPFALTFPTFPQLLSSYNWTLSLEENRLIVVKPSITYEIKDFKDPFDSTTRILAVSSSKLLMAGGISWKDFSVCINTNPSEIIYSNKLKTGRWKHCIGWVETYPAVIGGVCELGTCLDSVEIFKDGEWVSHSNINQPRCNITSVTGAGYTIIAGGTADYEGKNFLDSIEIYTTSWQTMQIKLNQPCCNIGTVNIGSGVLLIGGKNAHGQINGVFKLTDEKCERLAVTQEMIFKNNSIVLTQSFVKGKFYQKQKGDKVYSFEFNAYLQNTVNQFI